MSAQLSAKKPKRSTSLATTLTTSFVVLAVISLVLVSSFQMALNFQAQQAVIRTDQKNISLGAAQTVSNFVAQIFTVLESAVRVSNPFAGSAEEQKLLLEKLLGLEPALREVTLLDDKGQAVAKLSRLTIVTPADLTNQANSDLFIQTSQGQRYISSVYIDQTTSEPLATVALPIQNFFGDFEGILVAEVNLKFMWDLVGSLHIGEAGLAYVVDKQGNLLAFYDTSRVLQGENLKHLDEVAEFIEREDSFLEEEEENAFSSTGINGAAVVSTYYPLGTPDWAVVVELPVTEAYQTLVFNLGLSLAILLAVALLAGIAGVYVARRLAAPLRHLTATVTRIAEGEIELTAPLEGPTELTFLAKAFNSMTAQLRELIGSLEQRVVDRTQRLEIAATLGERMSAILNVEQLLAEVVNQIKDNFNYYHAHVYLLDDKREKLVVAEGAGVAGAEMKAKGHSISLDAPTSLVARAARTTQIVKVDNVRETVDWLPNPLLPDTHSEMAVPIILEGEVVGVLDVQEDKIAGLDEGDANLLRSLANQVAVAIRNARQFTEVQTALAEARAAQGRYLEQAWEQAKSASQNASYHYHQPGAVALSAESQSQTTLEVPIRLQNQTIGVIQLHDTERSQPWSERELALVEAVTEQIAQVAENIRLFEETRERAGREQSIREITDKLRAAPNLDALLETAARELGQQLGVRHTVLELGINSKSFEPALSDSMPLSPNGQ